MRDTGEWGELAVLGCEAVLMVVSLIALRLHLRGSGQRVTDESRVHVWHAVFCAVEGTASLVNVLSVWVFNTATGVYAYVCMCMCVYVCARVYMCAHVCVRVCVCMSVCTRVCMYGCVRMHICVNASAVGMFMSARVTVSEEMRVHTCTRASAFVSVVCVV